MASEVEQARLEELARLKAAQPAAAPAVKAALAAAPAVKIWRFFHFNTAAEAANFANLPPAQQAGEFVVTDDPAGGFDGFYFF